MTVTVYNIRAVADGSEAEISMEIQSGENRQVIKGTVSAMMLSELGFASRIGTIFEIDRMTCEAVIRCIKLQTAIKKGMSLLAFARNTKRGLKQKLIRKGCPAELAEEAVDFLADHGYIRENDDAILFAENLAEKKLYGRSRIKKELFVKGFAPDVISETMDSLEADFAEICAKRIKMMGNLAVFAEKESKSKAMASLMRYGFSYADVKDALELLQDE